MAAAVGASATGTDLKTQLDNVLNSIQPLVNGRKMLYEAAWSFSFTCSATNDDEVDYEQQFDVKHSIGYAAGVTSPTGENNLHFKISSDVVVDTAQPDLGYKGDDKTDGSGFATHQGIGKKSCIVGVGTHSVSETLLLELDVDSYGKSVADLVKQVEDTVKSSINLIDTAQANASLQTLLAQLYKLIKDIVKTLLNDLKDALTKSTGSIELKTSNFAISCLGRQKGAAGAP